MTIALKDSKRITLFWEMLNIGIGSRLYWIKIEMGLKCQSYFLPSIFLEAKNYQKFFFTILHSFNS